MALISTENTRVFIFGILGNICTFVVFMAPIPTFHRIWKKKSTEGFQSLPYLATLFSSMLWVYYASLKSGVFLLITINSFGCLIETIYIAFYITYAPTKARMSTLMLLFLLNFVGFSMIFLLSHFLAKESTRLQVLGWICMIFSLAMYVAPLNIMRSVIRSNSVEFMPFYLSLFLTINAIAWLFYGLFLKDSYVAIPNILGFIFGFLQLVLYGIYRNKSKSVMVEGAQLPQQSIDMTIRSPITLTSEEQNVVDQSGRVKESFDSNPIIASQV
ncbi:hypothetical protein SLA2020_080220 [Shorea laevis]